MNDSCPLCAADLSAAGEVIMDFGNWKLLLHPDAAVRGHAMLVAARHVENFSDLTETESQQLARVQKVSERALLDVTKTDRVILMKLGIAVPHFHLHLYPVSPSMTRAEANRMMNAEVSEEREAGFAKRVRDRILRLT